MVEILKTATSVATPLAFLGLAVAFAYFAYNRRLRHNEKQLESLPEDERARITDEYLTRYGIDGKKLRLTDKLALIRDEMHKRHQRSQSYLIVSAVVFVICFGLAVFAYVRTTPANNGATVVPGHREPLQITGSQSARGDLGVALSFIAGKDQDFPGIGDTNSHLLEVAGHASGQYLCSEPVDGQFKNPVVTVKGVPSGEPAPTIEVYLFGPRTQPDATLQQSTHDIQDGAATMKFEGTLPSKGIVFVVGWVEGTETELDWSRLSIWVE